MRLFKRILKNILTSFFILMIFAANVLTIDFDFLVNKLSERKIVDALWLEQYGASLADSFFMNKADAATIAQYSGGLLVYADGTAGTPKYRTFDDTNGFDTEQSASSVGASAIEWIRVVASPTADEWIIVTRDAGDVIKAQVCTGISGGISCGTPATITSTAGTHGYRNFDVAYEMSSGDALIVYGTATADELRKVEKASGSSSWTNDAAITTNRTTGTVEWVELTSRNGSDQIGIAYADTNDDISAYRWSGTAADNEHTAALLTTASAANVRKMDVSFEGASGDMLVAAPLTGVGTTMLGRLSGTTWTVSSDNGPDQVTDFIDLQEPHPSDNEIAMVTHGVTAAGANTAEGYEWSGTALVDGTVAADATALNWATGYQFATTAYLNSTYYAVGIFSDTTGADDINWWTMDNAGTWTLRSDNLRTRGNIGYVKLFDYPNADKVILFSSDANGDLWADTWDGSTPSATVWVDRTSGGALEIALPSTITELYDFAFKLGSFTTVTGTTNDTNNNGATVKVAINGTTKAQTGTIGSCSSTCTWSIEGVTKPAANDIVTVWVDNVTDANEATAVTKYSSGFTISGMQLNTNQLTIGSNQNSSVSVTNLGLCDVDTGCADEDVMHSSNSGTLLLEASGNTYTGDTLKILASNTLTVASASSESVTAEKINNAGTITATGTPTFYLNGTSGTLFTNTGTFTQATSTVNLSGNGSATINSGSPTFYNLTISGTGTKTLGAGITIASSGTLTVSAGTFNPLTYLVTGSGSNTLSVANGAILDVGASTFAGNYSTGFTTKTLNSGSIVDYNASGNQDILDLSYHHLNTSGSGTKTLLTDSSTTYINGILTIGNGTTFSGNNADLYLQSGSEITTPFVNNGTFDAGTGAVHYKNMNTGGVNIAAVDYYNLYVNDGGGEYYYNLSNHITINNSLFLESGYFNTTVNNYNISAASITATTGAPIVSFNNSTIGVSGDITISTGTVSANTANIDASKLIIDGGEFSPGASTVTLAGGSGTLFTKSSGTFTAGTSNIKIMGSGAILASGSPSFYNLTIDGGVGNTLTLGEALTTTNNLTLTSGTLDTAAASNYTINTGRIVMNGGTLTANTSTINLTATSGTLFSKTSGTFNGSGSTVNVTGAGNTTLASGTPAFNILTINGSGTKSLGEALTVNGALSVTAGTLDTAGYTTNTNTLTINGGILTASSSTINVSSASGTPFSKSSGTFNPNTSTINFTGNGTFTVDASLLTYHGITLSGTGTKSINATLSMTGPLTISSGTFDTTVANNYAVNAGSVLINGGTFTPQASVISLSGTGSVWSYSSGIFTPGTSTIKFTNSSSSPKIFAGGGQTYNNFWFAPGSGTGSLTISGSNTFNNFKDDGSVAHSLIFTTGTTQNITSWTVSGTTGNLITIDSTTTGTHALNFTGGGGNYAESDYLNIQHSVATPSDTWYAGDHSVNNQSVATAGSGWIFSARAQNKVYELTGFKFFQNLDGTAVGAALANQNSSATLSESGGLFRLRALVRVTGANLNQNGESFKLQFAERSGACDTSFVGESYQDVTRFTNIAFNDNFFPENHIALNSTGDGMTHGSTIVGQTYVELNNFSNAIDAVTLGNVAKWDFALYDKSVSSNQAYCLRIVKASDDLLDTYSYIPQITTAAYISRSAGISNLESGSTPGNQVEGGGQGGGGGIVLPLCSDTIDNDSDTNIDVNDPNCHLDGNINNPYVPLHNSETISPVSNSGGGQGGGGGDLGYLNKIINLIFAISKNAYTTYILGSAIHSLWWLL